LDLDLQASSSRWELALSEQSTHLVHRTRQQVGQPQAVQPNCGRLRMQARLAAVLAALSVAVGTRSAEMDWTEIAEPGSALHTDRGAGEGQLLVIPTDSEGLRVKGRGHLDGFADVPHRNRASQASDLNFNVVGCRGIQLVVGMPWMPIYEQCIGSKLVRQQLE
jgi:hypothetical protein